jgi:MFS family permease
MLTSLLLSLTQGLGMNLAAANLPQLQGPLGATTNEVTWLIAAYMAPNVSLSLILVKVRAQFGLRNFAELSILLFVLVMLLHIFNRLSSFASSAASRQRPFRRWPSSTCWSRFPPPRS